MRYSLSTDLSAPKIKPNPILEAKKIMTIKDKYPEHSNSRIAKKIGISRARVTQLLNLLKLAPEIQEEILIHNKGFTERLLRPLTHIKDHENQIIVFQKMAQFCRGFSEKDGFEP